MLFPAWDAVVFDYGRVLSQSPAAADLEQFARATGIVDPREFFEIYAETRAEYDSGFADYRQHWQTFCQAAGVTLAPDQVDRLAAMETRMWLRTNPEMLALARQIKLHGVQIAILSNMPHDLLAELRAGLDWLDEFPVQIWSCELGIVKPDPAIYRACLDALGCEPGRALFFDDRRTNVQGARDCGMQAHLFERTEEAVRIVHDGLKLHQDETVAR